MWKIRRDQLITNGIDDPRQWVRCGQDVIKKMDEEKFGNKKPDLFLVCLFHHQQTNISMLYCNFSIESNFPTRLYLYASLFDNLVLKVNNIDNDQIVNKHLFCMWYTVLTRYAEDKNTNQIDYVNPTMLILNIYKPD